MQYSIYGLIDPSDRSIFYVGKTSNIKRRFLEHKENKYEQSPKSKRIKAIHDAYQEIEYVLLEHCETNKDAFIREVFWIEMLRKSGRLLTNASMDYEGFYFLTEHHLEGEIEVIKIEKKNEDQRGVSSEEPIKNRKENNTTQIKETSLSPFKEIKDQSSAYKSRSDFLLSYFSDAMQTGSYSEFCLAEKKLCDLINKEKGWSYQSLNSCFREGFENSTVPNLISLIRQFCYIDISASRRKYVYKRGFKEIRKLLKEIKEV